MKRFLKLLIIISVATISLYAVNGKTLATKLGISASSKASIQWHRVFSKPKKMKKMGIDRLTDSEKILLESYLVSHAADSDAPEASVL